MLLDSPSFEEVFNSLMLTSEQSDSDGNFDEYVCETEVVQNHEGDHDYDSEHEKLRLMLECVHLTNNTSMSPKLTAEDEKERFNI